MPTELPTYIEIVKELEPLVGDFSPKIVGIDGFDRCGKTTLGRYLAWRFQITLIETDIFLQVDNYNDFADLKHNYPALKQVIQRRLGSKRHPVIVEGIALLQIFERLQLTPDFMVFCEPTNYETLSYLGEELIKYEEKYNAKLRANKVVTNLFLSGNTECKPSQV